VRINAKIASLAANPRPPGCRKLSEEEQYRLRQGDWRILYEINDTAGEVTIVKIAHRREAYRRR
jgi:mRNA interferase RelE/StbE